MLHMFLRKVLFEIVRYFLGAWRIINECSRFTGSNGCGVMKNGNIKEMKWKRKKKQKIHTPNCVITWSKRKINLLSAVYNAETWRALASGNKPSWNVQMAAV